MNYKIEPHFTTVYENHPYSCLAAVKDIQRMLDIMCVALPGEQTYGYVHYAGIGWSLCARCTAAAYERFTEVVSAKYHGLCEFDVYR